MKETIEGFFSIESLRWILRILLRLKHPLGMVVSAVSNGGLWWPPVVMGGGGGDAGAWVGVWREKG